MLAVLNALQAAPISTPVIIITTSDLSIKKIKTHVLEWESKGFSNTKDASLYRALLSTLCVRQAPTIFWKGVRSSNQVAYDSINLCALAEPAVTEPVNLGITPENELSGATLSTISQVQAYRMILDNKPRTSRPATEKNIQIIKKDLQSIRQRQPTNASIWKAVQSTTLRRRVRNFFFNLIHDSLKTGNFFKHIPNCEEQVNCSKCGKIDSIQHILLECQSPHRNLIWQTAKHLWPEQFGIWPNVSMGVIVGAPLVEFHDPKGQRMAGAN
jgi:hypothetical protein